MGNMIATVGQDSLLAVAEGGLVQVKANKIGYQIVTDFWTQMAIEGRCYQVRAGTITTPITSGVGVVDTEATMCVDAAVGTTIIPAALRLAIRDTAAQTTAGAFLKAVGVVSSAGTAFVPLPLLQGGPAATSTARVAAAGGVTVTAELATTTRRIWEWECLQTQSATVLAVGALGTLAAASYRPIVPYVGQGPACVYLQVVSNGGTMTHYGTIDYVELPTTAIS